MQECARENELALRGLGIHKFMQIQTCNLLCACWFSFSSLTKRMFKIAERKKVSTDVNRILLNFLRQPHSVNGIKEIKLIAPQPRTDWILWLFFALFRLSLDFKLISIWRKAMNDIVLSPVNIEIAVKLKTRDKLSHHHRQYALFFNFLLY